MVGNASLVRIWHKNKLLWERAVGACCSLICWNDFAPPLHFEGSLRLIFIQFFPREKDKMGGGKRCEGAGCKTYEKYYHLCGSFSYIRLRILDVYAWGLVSSQERRHLGRAFFPSAVSWPWPVVSRYGCAGQAHLDTETRFLPSPHVPGEKPHTLTYTCAHSS